jgi:hypothetical protein
MALYIPAGRRRRRTIVIAAVTLLAGLVIGVVAGRVTAPTVREEIEAVQDDARQTAAGLRVIALHDEAETVGSQGADSGGTALVLERTRSELEDEFDRAIWLSDAQRDDLLAGLDDLEAISDRAGTEFAAAAEGYAAEIEAAFGLVAGPTAP